MNEADDEMIPTGSEQLEGGEMLSSEELNDTSSRRNEPSLGMVFLLVSSLVQGGSVLSGSPVALKPQSAEAATLDDDAVPVKKKRTQGKASAQANSRETSKKRVIRGQASWYGPGFHGKKTASGEIFDQSRLTAAHKTLPLGTKAKVTNLENGNTVEVQINDRGPYVGDRVIDLSRAAANALGFVESGLTLVRIEPLYQEASAEEAG